MHLENSLNGIVTRQGSAPAIQSDCGTPICPIRHPDRALRPHICFVAPQAWPVFSGSTDIRVMGGAEVQQSILARLLAQAGYPVSMICFDYDQPQATVVDGVTIYKIHRPDAGVPVLRFIHPRITTMWQVMRRVDADIYYQRTAAMLTAVVAEFCRHYGKRSIYAGASDSDFVPGGQSIRYRRDRWLFEQGLARVDRLVVQNKRQQRLCQENYGRESMLIPSCYELPHDSRPRAGEYVLWVGVMRKNKRPELFIALAKRLPQLRFVMIGGPDTGAGDELFYESIRNAAMSLPNLVFTGFLPLAQVEPYFDKARVFVNTSPSEGMPNTFLQAWARGIPTVAFIDVGAHLLGSSVYAIVDGMDAAVEQIEKLSTDDAYHRHLESRCRDYFSMTHGLTKVLALYQRLLDGLVVGDRK